MLDLPQEMHWPTGAGLGALRRIDTVKTDAPAPDLEGIAVGDGGPAGDRLGRSWRQTREHRSSDGRDDLFASTDMHGAATLLLSG